MIRIADSRAQLCGGVDCPGFGRQGSNPVAVICIAPPQTKPAHKGASCQSSFCAITFWPEKSRKDGLASTPGTKKGAPDIEGPRPRTRTVFGAFPSITKPPITTSLPLCAMLLVDMFTSGVALGTNIAARETTKILPSKKERT